MKNYFLKYLFIFIICNFGILYGLKTSIDLDSINDSKEIEDLLPNEIKGWIAQGELEIAIGQDLYLVINGGAEIYHEYGFRKAVFQTYTNSNGNSINLEIYEMENNAAAFGMYSFKTSKEGIPLNLGYAGWLESYYLNFWKGNYLITLTSMQTDSSCIADLKKLAFSVDKKIICTSALPSLISYLPEKELQKNSITYLRGNLALFNQDIFGPHNIFGLKEGVLGEYPNYSIMIINYQNDSETIKWYKSAENYFKNNEGYKDFMKHETQFEISDIKNNRFWIKPFINFIIIVYGNNDSNSKEIFNSIIENIGKPK